MLRRGLCVWRAGATTPSATVTGPLYQGSALTVRRTYADDAAPPLPDAPMLKYSHRLEGDTVKVAEVPDAKLLGRNTRLFAVVRVQGKQHLVSEGDLIMTDHINGVSVGQTMPLTEVLVLGAEDMTLIGRPLVDPAVASVLATVEEHSQTEKVHVFKKKRRKGYKKRIGHRSDVTMLRITAVTKSAD